MKHSTTDEAGDKYPLSLQPVNRPPEAGRPDLDLGLAIPLDMASPAVARTFFESADELEYTSFWSGEIDGADGFTPLVLGASILPKARFGTSIVLPLIRGAPLLAQQAASMATAAPGRFALGIGPGSSTIVKG